MNPPVWIGSASLVIAFLIFGSSAPTQARRTFAWLQHGITHQLGWLYVISATSLLCFVTWLFFSRFGSIRLGPPDSKPEFRFFTWISMLLAAGMGIGIVFFGVAEPLTHFTEPPLAEPLSLQARRDAMRFTYYHWGFHPWAIYSAIAMPLAFFHFRYNLPLAPRSLLYPLIGERIHGWMGHIADIICTTGTLFGVATSLGLGTIQINAGLRQLLGWPISSTLQLVLITLITIIATISVVTGIKGGIRALSTFNIALMLLMLLFVLFAGPTVRLLGLFISSLGYYFQTLPFTSLWVGMGQRGEWQSNWTLFYWSWWISWSPFVGVFVARVSKGRSIREFIAAAMLVPTLTGFFWFAVMGGTGLYLYNTGFADLLISAEEAAQGGALFAVLQLFPLHQLTQVLAILLVIVFFVTSSDSGSLVNDMITSGGDPDPPVAQRIFWALSEGAVAGTLLLAGGLRALRDASLSTGLPMILFLLMGAVGFTKALFREMPRPKSVYR